MCCYTYCTYIIREWWVQDCHLAQFHLTVAPQLCSRGGTVASTSEKALSYSQSHVERDSLRVTPPERLLFRLLTSLWQWEAQKVAATTCCLCQIPISNPSPPLVLSMWPGASHWASRGAWWRLLPRAIERIHRSLCKAAGTVSVAVKKEQARSFFLLGRMNVAQMQVCIWHKKLLKND